jgi:GNAT superfamily N-acetyltransferase
MMPSLLFLKFLIFLELGVPAVDYQTEHCFVMKSGSNLPFGNRVCSADLVTENEIDEVCAYMDSTPFRWFVSDSDAATMQLLEQKGLHQITEYPAMIIDLDTIDEISYRSNVHVKEIGEEADIKSWISIVASSFEMNEYEFAKFAKYILNRSMPECVKLYLAFHDGIPVASSMTIRRKEVISVHWIGTLAKYRGKGIGAAISHKPLLDARAQGCKQAILLATDMGKPVYEKLGYKEYANYKVFSR